MRRLILPALLSVAAMGASCPKPKPNPTPSPTALPTATPSPSPTPGPQLMPGHHRVCWGCIGSRAEDATGQGWMYPRHAKLAGYNAPLFFTGTCRHGTEQPIDDAIRLWTPFLAQAKAEGAHPVIELDWADAVYAGGIESEILSAPHVDVVFEVVAPFRSVLLLWYCFDEAGQTKEMVEAKSAYIRKKERERGWAPLPIAGGFLEKELWELDGHKAEDIQLIIIEGGYAAGFGSGNRAEDARLIREATQRQATLIPAGKLRGMWCADYNRNGPKLEWNTDGGWAHSKEDLAALVFECRRAARDFDVDDIDASFCFVRGDCVNGYCWGGVWDWMELGVQQLKRAWAYLETGVDSGPAVPTPQPTPVPTPGPETVELVRSQCSWPAGTTVLDYARSEPADCWAIDRKNATDREIRIVLHATCWTPGPDCPDFDVVVTSAPGQRWNLIGGEVPAQSVAGSRYWHVELKVLDAGVGVLGGGNFWIHSADPSVNWIYPHYWATRGNPLGLWLTKGKGAAAQPEVTIVSGTDCLEASGGYPPWTVAMPADSAAEPLKLWAEGRELKLWVKPTAPAGCEIELAIVGSGGRTPTVLVKVQ